MGEGSGPAGGPHSSHSSHTVHPIFHSSSAYAAVRNKIAMGDFPSPMSIWFRDQSRGAIAAELARARRISTMLSDPRDLKALEQYIEELNASAEKEEQGTSE